MLEEVYPFFKDVTVLVSAYLLDLTQDPLREGLTLLAFLIAYAATRVLIGGLLTRGRANLRYLMRLISVLLLYSVSHYLLARFPSLNVLHLILVLLYAEVLRVIYGFSHTYLHFGLLSRVLFNSALVLNALFLFFQSLSLNVSALEWVYAILFKLTLAVMLSIYVPKLYSLAVERIKSEFLRRTLRRSSFVFLLLYLVVVLAWVFGTVRLSRDLVVKVSALAGVLFTYFLLQVYAVTSLERLLGQLSLNVKGSLRGFLSILSLFILYKGLDLLFDLTPIKGFLSRTYIIHTELLKISVLSLLESVYLFILLISFTNLLKNSVYVYFLRRGQEVEAGSLKALTSNLGVLISVTLSLVHLGVTWKVLVPFAGALGIGLGFGLQTIFNNYVSGFILLLSKNIKVGDFVELEGSAGSVIGREGSSIFGQVVNINILTTVVRTNDNVEVAIPNSEFVSGRIVNYSLSDPFIRVRIPFGVSYSSDPKKVEEVLLRVARSTENVLKEPPPQVWFYEMGDRALIFYLLVWVDIRRFWRIRALRSDIYFKAWEELRKEGIEIPFPQRDVWFKNPLKVEIDERGFLRGGSGGSKEGP